MNSEDFESHYQKYEQEFIQNARAKFDNQPHNNKVQYLRGVYRYLFLNRLLARKGHTVGSVLESRYVHRKRSAEAISTFVSVGIKRILSKTSSDMFQQMRLDVIRTLYDVFPDEIVKGGQFVSSATGIDILDHEKFGLRHIRHNIILKWIAENNIPVRTRSESQQVNASRMSFIKKRQAAKSRPSL